MIQPESKVFLLYANLRSMTRYKLDNHEIFIYQWEAQIFLKLEHDLKKVSELFRVIANIKKGFSED